MLKIFKRSIHSKYQERLKKSFPKELSSDLNEVLKILPLDNNHVRLRNGTIHKVNNLIHPSEWTIKFNN